MENNKRFYSVNMFRVCIDTYQEDISGSVYSPLSVDEIAFTGIGELLLKMDKLFDAIGYPQAFQDKRSFEGGKKLGNSYKGIPKAVRSVDSILDKTGESCTYDIEVVSRRNTSWQGVIYDVNGNEQGKFNGEVQLLEKLTELVEI